MQKLTDHRSLVLPELTWRVLCSYSCHHEDDCRARRTVGSGHFGLPGVSGPVVDSDCPRRVGCSVLRFWEIARRIGHGLLADGHYDICPLSHSLFCISSKYSITSTLFIQIFVWSAVYD